MKIIPGKLKPLQAALIGQIHNILDVQAKHDGSKGLWNASITFLPGALPPQIAVLSEGIKEHSPDVMILPSEFDTKQHHRLNIAFPNDTLMNLMDSVDDAIEKHLANNPRHGVLRYASRLTEKRVIILEELCEKHTDNMKDKLRPALESVIHAVQSHVPPLNTGSVREALTKSLPVLDAIRRTLSDKRMEDEQLQAVADLDRLTRHAMSLHQTLGQAAAATPG